MIFMGGPGGGQQRIRRPLDTGNYVVFKLEGGKPKAVNIRTGLTDLDYIEVISGLTEADTVLLLPSASLLTSQQQFRERFQQMTGGGLPGLRQQPQQGQAQGGGTAPARN